MDSEIEITRCPTNLRSQTVKRSGHKLNVHERWRVEHLAFPGSTCQTGKGKLRRAAAGLSHAQKERIVRGSLLCSIPPQLVDFDMRHGGCFFIKN